MKQTRTKQISRSFEERVMSNVLPILVPTVAVLLSNIQLASPLKAVLICRRHNELGSLNPVPWAVAFLNCLGYMLYGCLAKNPFVMASVTLGLPANYFAISSALSILGKTGKGSNNETTWKLEYIVLSGLMAWIVLAFVCGALLPAVSGDQAGALSISIVGYFCIATCMLYYFAPLTVVMQIIRNKDAAGLYTPMVVMNLITSVMWSIYGFALVGDPVVYAPNMFAVLLSGCQMYLKCTYPSIDASKLQRRMTIDNDMSEGEEEAKDMEQPHRHRATSISQEVLGGDGTVGVIEYNAAEEAGTRQRRSSTVTSVAEKVLDVIDFVGPRRVPLEHAILQESLMTSASVSASVSPSASVSFDASDPNVRTAAGVRSPLAGSRRVRVNSAEAAALHQSPTRRMNIGTHPDTTENLPGASPSTPRRNHARHRALSDPRALPVIAEEGSVLGDPDSSIEAQFREGGYSYGHRVGSPGRAVGHQQTTPGRMPPGPLLHSLTGLAVGAQVGSPRSRSATRSTQLSPTGEEVVRTFSEDVEV